jgi:hypothetical protein
MPRPKGTKLTPEQRARLSAAARRAWADPAKRARTVAGQRAGWAKRHVRSQPESSSDAA